MSIGERDIKRINQALDAMEAGKYAGLKISWITDRIVWLWKFKHITREQMEQLADRTTYIIDNYGLNYV